MGRPRLATWRDALRDSDLDRTAKLVAYTIGTYMNAQGGAFPSVDLIAAGASISDRAVHAATVRLEQSGFLDLERSRGRSSHRYVATLPPTANGVRRSEWDSTPNGATSTPNGTPPTPNAVRPKAFNASKAARSRARSANAAGANAKDICDECGVFGAHAADCEQVA